LAQAQLEFQYCLCAAPTQADDTIILPSDAFQTSHSPRERLTSYNPFTTTRLGAIIANPPTMSMRWNHAQSVQQVSSECQKSEQDRILVSGCRLASWIEDVPKRHHERSRRCQVRLQKGYSCCVHVRVHFMSSALTQSLPRVINLWHVTMWGGFCASDEVSAQLRDHHRHHDHHSLVFEGDERRVLIKSINDAFQHVIHLLLLR